MILATTMGSISACPHLFLVAVFAEETPQVLAHLCSERFYEFVFGVNDHRPVGYFLLVFSFASPITVH